MKRNLTLALMALALCSIVASTAHATQAVWLHKATQQLYFRNHQAAIVGNEADNTNAQYGVDGSGGFVDSLYASGIAKFDTTVAVKTDTWVVPFGGSAVDSSTYAKLLIYDSGLASVTLGKTSATAESIYVKAQVSANGVDWHDAAVIAGQAPVLNAFTVQTTVNAAVLTFVSSTNTGISGKLWSVSFKNAQNAAGLRSGQDITRLHEFPLVRFIIMGSRSLNHSYKAQLMHYSATTDLAK